MKLFRSTFVSELIIIAAMNVLAVINQEVSTHNELKLLNELIVQRNNENICVDSRMADEKEKKINCSEIFEKYGLHSRIPEDLNLSKCSDTFHDELNELLCRGDYQLPTDISSKLTCYFQHYKHPFLTIAPLKVEEIYNEPVILLYHDFLNDQEMEKLKYLAQKEMRTSRTMSKDGVSAITAHRQSMTAFLDDDDEEKELNKVVQRIADSTMLSMESSEDFQLVKYETGGYYKTHLDYFRHPKIAEEKKDNRIATFLMYLSDVPKGGYTVFPMLRLHIKPRKGAAVFWYNLLENGIGDRRTLHGACKVVEGTKWISTKWIREKGQEFERPCSVQNNSIS